jgi:hypothetical protein
VDMIGSNCASLVGRLPWFTLGIAELRDSANETLWYAVSDTFHANGAAVLNSDTPGNLSVSGDTNITNVAAVVFSAGASLPGQNRSAVNVNNVTHYLEGTNSTSITAFVSQQPSDTFNDRLLTIQAREIFHDVEKRVGRELRPLFVKYYSDWGRYPFAAPFADPSTSNFRGAAGTYEGLLPVTSAPNFSWNVAASTVTTSGGINLNGAASCAIIGNNLVCSVPILLSVGGETVTVIAVANNVGNAFAGPVLASDINYVGLTGDSSQFDRSLNAAAQGRIRAVGVTPLVVLPTTVSISVPLPILNLSLLPAWIKINFWHNVAYYAEAPGYAPGGANTCTPPANPCNPVVVQPSTACLSICDSRQTASLRANNIRALVTLTGPAITGTHPSATLADYLEGGNASTLDLTFERRPRGAAFNDQPIEISP